ncbi:MAG: hypothetical protein DSY87_04630 [Methylococcus sp.]|nr:MAG: hypothetical protein DSY87_04630 [Methylococcus sp.]
MWQSVSPSLDGIRTGVFFICNSVADSGDSLLVFPGFLVNDWDLVWNAYMPDPVVCASRKTICREKG